MHPVFLCSTQKTLAFIIGSTQYPILILIGLCIIMIDRFWENPNVFLYCIPDTVYNCPYPSCEKKFYVCSQCSASFMVSRFTLRNIMRHYHRVHPDIQPAYDIPQYSEALLNNNQQPENIEHEDGVHPGIQPIIFSGC